MKFVPHEYQRFCIQKIIDTKKVGIWQDMGLGKTVTTLTAVKELKYDRFQVRKVLVIAPKKVAEGTWAKEKDKWDHTKMLRISSVLGSQAKRIRALNTPADIYVINRENVVWLVDYYRNSWPFDMVVVDESSSFKSHKAKRFKALASIGAHIERLVELTGTPSPNGLDDLWSQIYLLDGGERLGRKYTQFRERYFDPGERGQNVIYNYKAKPGSEDSILEKISDICISMKAEDYLQLPDVTYHEIPVVLDDKASKAYHELERKMVLELPEAEDDISVTSAAALSNKLLQLGNGAIYDEGHEAYEVHGCKIEAFLELIESLQGKPALVFYNFQHDRARIQKALEKSRLRVRELKTTQDEDAWNNHEVDILLTHPASSAYGLNLQQGGNHVIWFGLTWNYELYTQANKRLHRQGQKEKVIVHHLICTGTRDEDVMEALKRKEDVQEWVMQSLKARIRKIKDEHKA
ncbi:DEAD/DEAH box helicase [Bariatricus massiliensis]|uniref:DEAD/DEAH box helicase n=1 Tax=Bariatricus massiliensis TaxID=1745713 RepID=A0ABS8DHI4_9FIRM|nr:DEAD/DEAH box helicase [Bariatricus massiliensis]MCB7304837.1 DEAD/DEAH box helicase [Bariatricus massiliensis]MCB7375391.1 DEAD/DEAH box helicase [Bariatricus massiliensis]MCB7387851.1 DEAD/DEAH box helicase [Bariatricus massiliensis]MCB7412060.1 DEAD/DEAH box helicase [Bariatricus massiliensis]MCQ5254559.1 DEAD/DEAH box helicase [Bariatricus massiliensis]